MPNPAPTGVLVVKNVSNIFFITSSDIPSHVSETPTNAVSSSLHVLNVILPPSGIASSALFIKFINTSLNSVGIILMVLSSFLPCPSGSLCP